jgi:hypothetical protein
MDKYLVTITGKTPLLMHHDDIDWADKMTAWKNDAANKKSGVAGDDRSPSWRWIGSLYHDNKLIVIPQDNIMRSIMEGGAMVPVPGGKSGKTFKSQTQSGIASADAYWPLTVNGQTISVAEVHKLMQVEDFAAHKEAVLEHGFSLFLKRARIGQAKHIRVRPRFDSWSVSGTLIVLDKQITQAVLTDILMYSGQYKGLGDWRPGGKTPGPYGMFTAKVTKVM